MVAQYFRSTSTLIFPHPEERKRIIVLIAVAVGMLLNCVPLVHAQSFNCGSKGEDGALNLTTPGTYDFYPGNTQIFPSPVDPEGDNIYRFSTINIASGVTLRMYERFLSGPVFLLVSGTVQIGGTIDLNGSNGHPVTGIAADRIPSIPGAGGYGGGIGGNSTSPPQAGHGPGGGRSGVGDPNGFGGGGSFTANAFLVPLIGGSGGGGGARGDLVWGGGGGAGGGALLICSSASIAVNGTISANGGNETSPGNFNHGGGGSGGAIRLVAPTLSGTGTLSMQQGQDFLRGSFGKIRLEAFQNSFNGTINPDPSNVPSVRSLGSPFALFLPTTPVPSIRVVSVDGKPVPSTPTGTFTMPDVTIDKATAVTVQIQDRNVPTNATVNLHIFSEDAPDQIVPVAPVSGSTADWTASVTLSPGFSRGFVRAKWATQP
jgi:hypothetical protein